MNSDQAALEEIRRDAARWRFIAKRRSCADFEYDSDRRPVLIIEWPYPVSGDFAKDVDYAISTAHDSERFSPCTYAAPTPAASADQNDAGQMQSAKRSDQEARNHSFMGASGEQSAGSAPASRDADPSCETCGVPITTGMMALLCPRGRQCEFVTDDEHWQIVKELRTGRE